MQLEKIVLFEGQDDECSIWKIKDSIIMHHPTEPAVQYTDGDWVWFWMGKIHRWDSIATKFKSNIGYWIHGEEMKKSEWESHPLRLEWLRERGNLF